MALGLTNLTNVLGTGQSLAGLVHTYDSGGQLPVPGVLIGNEALNVSVAPDNDPADLGIDIAANVANGVGPQVDGQGLGVLLDIDTTSLGSGLAGIDDNDTGNESDLAILGNANQTADDGVLAVHLSGIGPHGVDGVGDVLDTGGLMDGTGIGDIGLLGLLEFDHV